MPTGRGSTSDFDDVSSTPLLDLLVLILGLVSLAGGALALLATVAYDAGGHRAWAAYDAAILVCLVVANVSLLLARRWVRRHR